MEYFAKLQFGVASAQIHHQSQFDTSVHHLRWRNQNYSQRYDRLELSIRHQPSLLLRSLKIN